MKTHYTNSKEETLRVAEELELDANVILLEGELGVGKTTFAQGVLTALGVEGPFTSPTFVIAKQYKLGKSQITNYKNQINSKFQIPNSKFNQVFHFDCYRVGSEDILELGWEEIIKDPKNLVLVEWPERIKKIWPEKYLLLKFEHVSENERKISVMTNSQVGNH